MKIFKRKTRKPKKIKVKPAIRKSQADTVRRMVKNNYRFKI